MVKKINVDSITPLKSKQKSTENNTSLVGNQTNATSDNTDKLSSLVLELANQVKGLKNVINTEIEDKKKNESEMINL